MEVGLLGGLRCCSGNFGCHFGGAFGDEGLGGWLPWSWLGVFWGGDIVRWQGGFRGSFLRWLWFWGS